MRYCLKEGPYSVELLNLTDMKCVRELSWNGKKVRLWPNCLHYQGAFGSVVVKALRY